MTRSLSLAMALVVSASFCARAFAGEVAIKSEDYAQLPADTQAKLLAKMKEEGLLGADDKVTNTAEPPAEKRALGPAVLLTLIPGVCKVIAEAKKQDELGQCAKKLEPAAQEQCKTEVATRFGSIETICGAIKIM